jgi:hypothetical protein
MIAGRREDSSRRCTLYQPWSKRLHHHRSRAVDSHSLRREHWRRSQRSATIQSVAHGCARGVAARLNRRRRHRDAARHPRVNAGDHGCRHRVECRRSGRWGRRWSRSVRNTIVAWPRQPFRALRLAVATVSWAVMRSLNAPAVRFAAVHCCCCAGPVWPHAVDRSEPIHTAEPCAVA